MKSVGWAHGLNSRYDVYLFYRRIYRMLSVETMDYMKRWGMW